MGGQRTKFWLTLLLVAGCTLALPPGKHFGQSPDQEPTGPKPSVDETVIVPKKKSEPTPVKPPEPTEKINLKDIYSISTSTNLVNLDVMVVDKDGNPIPSLTSKNFKVYDDGVPQTVTNFGTGEAPMTICLLIEFANRNWTHLYLALQDAYQFLQFMQAEDWVAVVDFDMKPHILQDFTQDRYEVKGALDTLRIPGFSEINLYDAVAYTLDRMKDIQGRKAIVPIVTGIDTFSKLNYDQILKIVKNGGIPIYPVSILDFLAVRSPRGDSISVLQARNSLDYIAKYSGGKAYFPRFEGELPEIYRQVAGQLRTEYSVGFVPTNPTKDGKFHKLKVDLVDDQGNPLRIVNQKGKEVKYKLLARDGYYAPKS